MTTGLTPPHLVGDISSMKKRITDLERRLNTLNTKNPYLGVPFSLAGSVYVSESPPWASPTALRISSIVALLGTGGSTTTTVQLKINGTPTVTINMSAGTVISKLTTSILVAPDQDILTVACTGVGTGARDLDVIVRFT